ncbi:MAG: fibrobacter succinogenes major paralogous domain-containing protein [Ferruginibacter sp.]
MENKTIYYANYLQPNNNRMLQKSIKKINFVLIGILIAAITLSSCAGSGTNEESAGRKAERTAGQGEIKTGDQIWMGKNLDISKFRNGDSIPEAKTSEEWLNAFEQSMPAWCYYDNDSKNGLKYGKLYNWFAVSDSRMLAPEGWEIPSRFSWESLKQFCDTSYSTNVDIDHLENTRFGTVELIDRKDWDTLCKGNNKSGFTGLPGGYRDSTGNFLYYEHYTGWWSTTDGINKSLTNANNNSKQAYVFLVTIIGQDYHNGASQACGFSVRCVR